MPPILDLTRSVEALSRGDFDRRVSVTSADELGRLASGFNQMAEALAEFRRLNLDEVFRAKETLESTLAALPDAVIVVDPDGDVVAANPTASGVFRALGLGPVRRVEQLPLSRDGLDAVRGQLRGDRADMTRPDLGQALPVALNGQQAKLLPTVMPIPEFSGGRPGAVVVLYDVTEFARLDELRAEMIAVASHELKTPLTTLRMNLMLMRERAAELSPLLREILATAAVGCEDLAATIDELLDLTRIEAGQLRLNLDRVDLLALAGHVADKFLSRFEENGVRLDFVRGCDRAVVRGDAARLGVVLSNLLTNALKYHPARRPGGDLRQDQDRVPRYGVRPPPGRSNRYRSGDPRGFSRAGVREVLPPRAPEPAQPEGGAGRGDRALPLSPDRRGCTGVRFGASPGLRRSARGS